MGFTLVEVIIVVVLVGIVTLISGNVLSISLGTIQHSIDEFRFQSDVRFAAGWAVSRIRYATAIFTVPEGSFRPDNLAPGWNYYGVEQVTAGGGPASRIVHYIWDPNIGANGDHILPPTEIVPPRPGISYRVVFSKKRRLINYPYEHLKEGDLLDFDIAGFVRGKTTPYMVIEGTTLPANALQAVDNGTESHPATAIAYRRDELPPAYVGHIALVLDLSGSMAWDLNGRPRVDILREAAEDLLIALSSQSNIDISIIRFRWHADFDSTHPGTWMNIQQGVTTPGPHNLLTQIRALEPSGTTNTGDGLRRAYHQLWEHSNNLVSGIPRRYVILMVDGDTNTATVNPMYDNRMPLPEDYFYGNGNVGLRWMDVDHYLTVRNIATAVPIQLVLHTLAHLVPFAGGYVEFWGEKLIEDDFATPYVIAFSNSVSNAGAANVGGAFGLDPNDPDDAEHFFTAMDGPALIEAFDSIKRSILNDLWHLNGPSL